MDRETIIRSVKSAMIMTGVTKVDLVIGDEHDSIPIKLSYTRGRKDQVRTEIDGTLGDLRRFVFDCSA